MLYRTTGKKNVCTVSPLEEDISGGKTRITHEVPLYPEVLFLFDSVKNLRKVTKGTKHY